MQDRFKFRVFSTTNNKYTDIEVSTALAANSVSNNQFVIQQCLGVKDKNNRLIYEGDIVKYSEDEVDEDDYTLVMLSPSLGKVTYSDNASFIVKTIHIGSYQYWDEISEGEHTLDFYSWDGQEFSWKRLEIIASIADNYLIDLEGNVISTLTNTEDMLKQLGV